MKLTLRRCVVLVLLAAGIVLFTWMNAHANQFNLTLIDQKPWFIEEDMWHQRMVLAGAAILTIVPFTRRWLSAIFGFLRDSSRGTRLRIAVTIFILSGPLIYGLGAVRGRLGQPIWHDENMYRMQTTFLAHGKFCMPGLPHPDFFDSPYVFVRGVYAPVYFPGTAMLHVPATWMHLPYWVTPLLIAMVSVALLYWVISELIDGLAGIIAVVLMISLHTFRWLALVEMSHGAGMMWGLVVLTSWLVWRHKPEVKWGMLAGAGAGFYAITRPLDAICVLMPVALAWVWDLLELMRGRALFPLPCTHQGRGRGEGLAMKRRDLVNGPSPYPSPLSTGERGPERGRAGLIPSTPLGEVNPAPSEPTSLGGINPALRSSSHTRETGPEGHFGASRTLLTVCAAIACALPLICVQLCFDRAVTGNLLETPLARYNTLYFNARSLGLQTYDPTFRPPTPVPQIQKLYDDLDRKSIMNFTTARQVLRGWIRERVPLTLGATTPSLFLVILLPVALLGLTDRRRLALWSMAWCYLIGAGFFYIFSAQYTIACAPAMLFAVLLGVHVIERTWPKLSALSVFLPLSVLMLGVQYIAMNQQNFFEPIPQDRMSLGWVSQYNYHQIPQRVQKPALVFFHFDPTERAWEEPVYNWDVLNPDNAPIIRAHDLGWKKNRELLEYYAKTQPDRHVYWFDRLSLDLRDLGKVGDALKR